MNDQFFQEQNNKFDQQHPESDNYAGVNSGSPLEALYTRQDGMRYQERISSDEEDQKEYSINSIKEALNSYSNDIITASDRDQSDSSMKNLHEFHVNKIFEQICIAKDQLKYDDAKVTKLLTYYPIYDSSIIEDIIKHPQSARIFKEVLERLLPNYQNIYNLLDCRYSQYSTQVVLSLAITEANDEFITEIANLFKAHKKEDAFVELINKHKCLELINELKKEDRKCSSLIEEPDYDEKSKPRQQKLTNIEKILKNACDKTEDKDSYLTAKNLTLALGITAAAAYIVAKKLFESYHKSK